MTRVTAGYFFLNPYPYPSTPSRYPYGKGYGYTMVTQGLHTTITWDSRRVCLSPSLVVIVMAVGCYGGGRSPTVLL